MALSTVAAILVPKAVASSAAAGNMQEAEVTYTHTHTHTHICMYVCMYVCVCVCVCLCVCVYIYIYIHTYIYVQCLSRKPLHLQQPRVTCRIVSFVLTFFYFTTCRRCILSSRGQHTRGGGRSSESRPYSCCISV